MEFKRKNKTNYRNHLKVFLIATPIVLVIFLYVNHNYNWTDLFSIMSSLLGIVSYYISIYLIDSTDKIRENLIIKQREKTKNENYKNEFKAEYNIILKTLDDFLEVIKKIWNALDNSGEVGKYETEYLDIKRKLLQYLSKHNNILRKYDDYNEIESYLSLINKSKPYKLIRKYNHTFIELNSRTSDIKNIIKTTNQFIDREID